MSAIRGLLRTVNPLVKFLPKNSLSAAARSGLLPLQRYSPVFTAIHGFRFYSAEKPQTKSSPNPFAHQQTVTDKTEAEELLIEDVVSKVNKQIEEKSHGRLFAVVSLFDMQWKITPEDVLVIEGYWPPNVGDNIRLEKVLLVGSSEFTLVGMPLLRPDLINIQATVIEKRLSHTKINFKKKNRKQYQRINFYRYQQTMIRINSIELTSKLNEVEDVEGLVGRIY